MPYERPSHTELSRLIRVGLDPLRAVVQPSFSGLENVPDERPLLFVGNHTLGGIFDVPFLWAEVYQRRGIFLRTLGDHLHFRVPGWRSLVQHFGVVHGTRENVRSLFLQGEHVMVFPGGAREVAKRKNEKYRLVWKQRMGFARMAIEQGVTIVPFSAVGVEDALDVLVDANDWMRTPLGPLVRALRVRDDVLVPIVRGIGPTPIPRPERLYFHVGTPVETRHLRGHEDDPAVCLTVRERVRAEVERGIAKLREERERDPLRPLVPRLLNAACARRAPRAPGP